MTPEDQAKFVIGGERLLDPSPDWTFAPGLLFCTDCEDIVRAHLKSAAGGAKERVYSCRCHWSWTAKILQSGDLLGG